MKPIVSSLLSGLVIRYFDFILLSIFFLSPSLPFFQLSSSLYFSNFDETVNLSIDGFGDFVSCAWGKFKNGNNDIDKKQTNKNPKLSPILKQKAKILKVIVSIIKKIIGYLK